MMNLYPLIRPLLFHLDAETAHDLTLKVLQQAHRVGLTSLATPIVYPQSIEVMGLVFPNPVGLSAGLDKDGRVIDAMATLGFGFIEIGTVTPRPQIGNPKPRMFRLPEHGAIINRLGFNNQGIEHLLENVRAARYRGILGINIGKNADTPNDRALHDYLFCLHKVYPYASYVTINISSPNTRNLRQLQEKDALTCLLSEMKLAQTKLADQHGRYVPLVLKIAPDLNSEQVVEIADLLKMHRMDGVIATNTTLSRDAVSGHVLAEQVGGLSGRPLLQPSTEILRQLHQQLGNEVPIIGVGGINCGEDAQQKIEAGARLVQIYSGLVYRGPVLIREICQTLAASTVQSVLR